MKRLVEFPLEDGTSILVEVDEPETEGMVSASRDNDVIEKAHHTLEASLEKVRPAAQFVVQQFRKLNDAPDEIEVTFGLKLSAEAGAVLASAGIEANYTVKLKWAKPKPESKPKA